MIKVKDQNVPRPRGLGFAHETLSAVSSALASDFLDEGSDEMSYHLRSDESTNGTPEQTIFQMVTI